jgi:hypothetical protein
MMLRQLIVLVEIALASMLCVDSTAAVGAQHGPRQSGLCSVSPRGVTTMVCVQRSLGVVLLAILFGCGGGGRSVSVHPVAQAGPNQTVTAGDVVTLDGSASEPSGSIRSYSWAQVSGPSVALSNANNAKAPFVAPDVTRSTDLAFQLMILADIFVDTNSTVVTVQPKPVAALAKALALFDSTLAPASATIGSTDDCAPATAGLSADRAAAQRGLWLAARAIAISSGLDAADPTGFLDAARVQLSEHPVAGGDIAGQIESFGFLLLGQVAETRDPALRDAIDARMRDAILPDDPAALLGGRSKVVDTGRVEIQSVADPAAASANSIDRLLAVRTVCVQSDAALDVTAAGFRVIAEAATRD